MGDRHLQVPVSGSATLSANGGERSGRKGSEHGKLKQKKTQKKWEHYRNCAHRIGTRNKMPPPPTAQNQGAGSVRQNDKEHKMQKKE